LQVFNRELNLGLNETALKMATAFGAGLGACKDCCGALTGAVLVLSAVKGRVSKDEPVSAVFAGTQKLHTRFKRVLTSYVWAWMPERLTRRFQT
jgi:C_GCAxxG_C_C family probable redox protein